MAGSPPPIRKAAMANWYGIPLLMRTGFEVLISGVFGRHSDRRLVQSAIAGPPLLHDYAVAPAASVVLSETAAPPTAAPAEAHRGDFWFDFVADIGDGWDPTYAVAYAMTRAFRRGTGTSALALSSDSQGELCRPALLVIGGDVVYPYSTPKEYEQRLLQPYQAAFSDGQFAGQDIPGNPQVFAIPGNHDWYDSLASFSRHFCSQEPFAGCATPQRRSYFALRLPHGWWLLGVDVQLGTDLDGPQVDYFRAVARRVAPGERVILCTHEPYWLSTRFHEKAASRTNVASLAALEALLPDRVKVFLAGDLHHYRRHASADGVQKVTAGGGGAFLHPTCGPDVEALADDTLTRRASYPSWWASWWLAWLNLLFPLRNPWFGALPATLYLVVAWTLLPSMDLWRSDFVIRNAAERVDAWTGFGELPFHVLKDVCEPNRQVSSPFIWIWFVAITAGFIFFTDLRSLAGRIVVGSAHALVHFNALLWLAWLGVYCFYSNPGAEPGVFNPLILRLGGEADPRVIQFSFLGLSALIFVGGWLIGSLIWGAYLLVALMCGFHWNEAFSSLRLTGWKNFLRLRIAADGSLTIYPIGICQVPARWPAADAPGPIYQPGRLSVWQRLLVRALLGRSAEAQALPWHLIEPPIPAVPAEPGRPAQATAAPPPANGPPGV